LKLYFVDQNYGWAVGYHGLVYTTSDGGENWCKKYIEEDVRLNGLCFVNLITGWIVGNSGSIYHTEDGGSSWLKQFSNVTNSLWFVQFVDSNNGWICGYMLDMLRTKTGGTSSIETSYVDNIDLSIIPNPVDDKALIRFSTINSGNIVLNLSDIFGKTVCRICEGYNECGTRDIMFDSEKIVPGIYFLTLSHFSNQKITNKTIKLVISK
jgi:hypothetical protein